MHDLVSHSGSTVLVDPLLDGGSFGDLVLAMQPRQRCPCFIFLDHLFLEGHTVPFDYFSFHFPVLSFLLFAPLVQGTAQNNITDPTMQAVVGAVITVLIRSFAVQSLLLLFIGVIVLVVNHAQVQPAEQSQAAPATSAKAKPAAWAPAASPDNAKPAASTPASSAKAGQDDPAPAGPAT
jgi:hypothetical protein